MGAIMLTIDKSYKPLENIKCHDFYWHLLNDMKHIPTSVSSWNEELPDMFKDINMDIWKDIFTLAFRTTRETKIQSFQYRLLHRALPCNVWLNNIKVKNSSICSYCDCEDTIQHFLIFCRKAKLFWTSWIKWWKCITGINFNMLTDSIVDDETAECFLFGHPGDNDIVYVTNYCILVAKYHVYIQKLLNDNHIEFYNYLVLLKQKLYIEKICCQNNDKENDFEKFSFIYDSL